MADHNIVSGKLNIVRNRPKFGTHYTTMTLVYVEQQGWQTTNDYVMKYIDEAIGMMPTSVKTKLATLALVKVDCPKRCEFDGVGVVSAFGDTTVYYTAELTPEEVVACKEVQREVGRRSVGESYGRP